MRCRTCRHWGNRELLIWTNQKNRKSCGNPKMVYGYLEDCDNDGLCVEDDEGWGMLTGPDFGCIHWEEE